MTTMISEVYDAFRSAEGVGEERARKAAEAIAAYETRFAGLELKLEEVKGSIRIVQWMLGTVIAGVAALVIRSFA